MELIPFSLLLCFALTLTSSIHAAASPPQTLKCKFPAIFNFGDSNSDTGASKAAKIKPPYRQFCNQLAHRDRPCLRPACDGRLIIDFIAEELGLPYLPGFNVTGANYRNGVSFAWYAKAIPDMVKDQLAWFLKVRNSSIETPQPDLPSEADFSKALYTLDIGQNDIAGLHMESESSAKAKMAEMMDQLSHFIQKIYDIGGRTFWIHNTGPLGCLPAYIERMTPGQEDEVGCFELGNIISQDFNQMLKDLTCKLRSQLNDVSIIYVDIYSAKYSLIKNAATFGFKDPFRACSGEPRCANPKELIFYDKYHYTEVANEIVARGVMNGSFSYPQGVSIRDACRYR